MTAAASTFERFQYRIPLNALGLVQRADQAYGGRLDAWSFSDMRLEEWYAAFRERVLGAMGRDYLPVFRMADSEFRFLVGRRFNAKRRPRLREWLAFLAARTGLWDPQNRGNSWGELYCRGERRRLRAKFLGSLKTVAAKGYLAPFFNDNGTGAFTEYMRPVCDLFDREGVRLDSRNYVPFHLVFQLLTDAESNAFYRDRSLLVVTSLPPAKQARILETLRRLGARSVQFLSVSATKAMLDTIEIAAVRGPIDLCLVAAGMGSANVLCQLTPLNTAALDIGGYMNCLEDPARTSHALFRVPLPT